MSEIRSFSVQEAYAYLAAQIPSQEPKVESVAIEQAIDRILSAQPDARVNAPPEDNSAMDGFAIAAADVQMNQSLRISQRIPAGTFPAPLEKGTAARIFTGAVMPQGADTVVIQEHCQYDEASMTIVSKFKPLAHVRRTGSDIKAGEGVLAKGHRLRPQDIGLLITVGVRSVTVYRRLRVAVVATGDELLDISEDLVPGKIYESNSRVIAAKLAKMGCVATRYRVNDSLAETEVMLRQAAKQNDAVITIGGVSVGEEDHVQAALTNNGRVEFWKINMKPGKPFLFGQIDDVPVMGLPGNPVSAFVTFSLFCQPFIRALGGGVFAQPRRWQVVSGFDKSQLSDREDYLRGCLTESDGRLTVAPVGVQLSSIQGSLCAADVLIVVPLNTEVVKGQLLEVISLQEMEV